MKARYGSGHDPALPFGCAFVSGIDREAAGRAVEAVRSMFTSRLEDRLKTIQARLRAFDAFFRRYDHRCPLPGQLESARRKGLPKIDPIVDALLYGELTTGLLMGVQDRDPMQGDLIYDVAEAGEGFAGMRGPVRCSAGEIVLRDDLGIVASYFQGPDFRTRVTPKTTNVVFFAFAAPGLDTGTLREGLGRVVALLEKASRTSDVTLLTTPGASR